jgi:hypothetical protein
MEIELTIIISALPIDSKGGGGWVSSRLNRREKFNQFKIRNDFFLFKAAWAILGILRYPFLHPIFCRYTPWIPRFINRETVVWLNFSQTFALALGSRPCVLVCHDLQCHVPHRFKTWLRWSEGFLLRRGERVVVLSLRDAKVVRRYYKVAADRIENLGPFLTGGLVPFKVEVPGPVQSVAFLGSLDRRENYEGLMWFVQHVLPACPTLQVMIIGQQSPRYSIDHPQLRYLGYVENLKEIIRMQDLMIAPMFSQAGIKIKVIESLLERTPVLGTRASFSGLPKPEGSWITDRPTEWIARLNQGGTYSYSEIVK